MAYSSRAQSYLASRAAEREDAMKSAAKTRSETTRAPSILDTKVDDSGEYTGPTEGQLESRAKAQGYSGPLTSQESIEAFQEAYSPVAKTAKALDKASKLGAMFGYLDPMTVAQFSPALGFVGALDTGMSVLGALAGTIEEGAVGDLFGTRVNEFQRDAVEDAGFDSKSLARTDNKTLDFGLGFTPYGMESAYQSTALGQYDMAAREALGMDSRGDVGSPSLGDFGAYGTNTDIGQMTDLSNLEESTFGKISASFDPTDTGGYSFGDSLGVDSPQAEADDPAGYGGIADSLGDSASGGGNGAGDSGGSGDGSTGRAGGPDSDAGSVGF